MDPLVRICPLHALGIDRNTLPFADSLWPMLRLEETDQQSSHCSQEGR